MKKLGRSFAFALSTVALACGGGGGGGDTGFGEQPQSSQVTIVFENRQFTDCTVFWEGPTGRRRLGRLSGNQTGRWRVPHAPTGFVITAAYAAVGDFSTQEILADPGTTVTVTSHSTGNLTFSISGP